MDVRAGARGRVGLNIFHNDVTDLIESSSLGFIATPAQLAAITAAEHLDPAFNVQLNRLLFLYKNVTHARTQGAELEGDMRLGAAVRLSGSYAYLDAVNEDTGLALTGRNRQHGTIRLDWTPARFGLRANLRGGFYSSWIVSRTTTATGTVDTRAPAFALWDLSVSKTPVGGGGALRGDREPDQQPGSEYRPAVATGSRASDLPAGDRPHVPWRRAMELDEMTRRR